MTKIIGTERGEILPRPFKKNKVRFKESPIDC